MHAIESLKSLAARANAPKSAPIAPDSGEHRRLCQLLAASNVKITANGHRIVAPTPSGSNGTGADPTDPVDPVDPVDVLHGAAQEGCFAVQQAHCFFHHRPADKNALEFYMPMLEHIDAIIAKQPGASYVLTSCDPAAWAAQRLASPPPGKPQTSKPEAEQLDAMMAHVSKHAPGIKPAALAPGTQRPTEQALASWLRDVLDFFRSKLKGQRQPPPFFELRDDSTGDDPTSVANFLGVPPALARSVWLREFAVVMKRPGQHLKRHLKVSISVSPSDTVEVVRQKCEQQMAAVHGTDTGLDGGEWQLSVQGEAVADGGIISNHVDFQKATVPDLELEPLVR